MEKKEIRSTMETRENRAKKKGNTIQREKGKEMSLLGQAIVQWRGKELVSPMDIRASINTIIPPALPKPSYVNSFAESDGPPIVTKLWLARMMAQLPPPEPPNSGACTIAKVTSMANMKAEMVAVSQLQSSSAIHVRTRERARLELHEAGQFWVVMDLT
ncbi:hypothetical protein SESBI_07503 [Sesbania bispinosa]|nr:hypothetical protein SESBI_07503 [Sesbania bispinosa]